MQKITDIDKNFVIKSEIDKEGIVWHSAKSEPFKIFGLLTNEEGYVRMPSEVAAEVSEFVSRLNRHTSGGRVTFESSSKYLAISASVECSPNSHMTYLANAGFDVYMDEGNGLEFYKPLIPTLGKQDYETIIEFETAKKRKFLIHFPLYAEVKSLYIGLDGASELGSYNPYKDEKPIVFYGSSVTQGGCASRPGNNYTAITSFKTGIDFTCLGFSGSAKAEKRLAEYIAGLEMSAFVYSYDINDIYDNEGKRERHFQFYDIVRQTHPDIPIIITSACYSWYDGELIAAGRPIIMDTLKKARERGDNVYFIDGQTVYGEEFKSCGSVDGCHPNDFGFVMMAKAVLDVLKECGMY